MAFFNKNYKYVYYIPCFPLSIRLSDDQFLTRLTRCSEKKKKKGKEKKGKKNRETLLEIS